MKITRRQLRRVIWEAMEQAPRWPESHPAWRDVAFTRDNEIRYILDVADSETVQAAADIGEPFPPGTNVLIIKGATPDSEKVFLHDSELLDLINREGWRIPEPPPGAGPGMWGGHGKWIEDLPEAELPPAMEEPIGEGKKMRITRRQLRHIIEASKSTIKYNADDALKGDQTKLPDDLQKGIIDAEDDEEEEIKEMKITKRHLKQIIKEVLGMSPELEKLKQDDPMGYLQAKFGEGAALTTKEMEEEGVYDAYEDWIQNALDDGDPEVELISRDLAIHLPTWNKK